MKRIMSNVVLFCGGVNVQFLRENCDNERHKFYPIGLGVIITTLLGFISMMFATHSIFGADTVLQEIYLILFSLFWGFAIFTIDWGLVKTMKKPKTEEASLWQWVRLVLTVLFRLAVAIILSFSISRPLEVKIYEQRLSAQIQTDKQAYIDREDSIKEHINQERYGKLINGYDTAITGLNNDEAKGPQQKSYLNNVAKSNACSTELKAIKAKNEGLIGEQNNALTRIRNNPSSYRYGTPDSGYTREAKNARIYHNNQIQRLSDEVDEKERECNGYDAKIEKVDTLFAQGYNTIMDHLLKQQQIQQTALKQKQTQDAIDRAATRKAADIAFDGKHPGLITELESLSNFEKTPEGRSAGWVRIILLMVIICIDTSPIVIKLLTKRGVYEEMVEADEDRMRFLSKQESLSNKFLIKDLALAQKDILSEAVKQWREKERGRDDLGDRYINTNSPDEE